MDIYHKILATLLMVLVFCITSCFNVGINFGTAIFCLMGILIAFGFCATSATVLYNSNCTKRLHNQIDEEEHKRVTQVLRSSLLVTGRWFVFSFVLVIISIPLGELIRATVYGNMELGEFGIYLYLYIRELISALLYGVISVNIYFLIISMNNIIYTMNDKAKQ